ncbi:hypothetical protein C7374_11825 [Falsochrobactrum ovis]|uniref:Uncharacterized protein n=1 Tax=Falsochrobactrum ovis TaxID=1293442 RepID=A0A364JS72_9HYPH|nr:hypothetical protein C7374_11825 [Falsochrobactrum ovis]
MSQLVPYLSQLAAVFFSEQNSIKVRMGNFVGKRCYFHFSFVVHLRKYNMGTVHND